MTGKTKDKEKESKKGKKKGKRSAATGGTEDVDTSEADLLALLANQVVKEEKKKLNSKLRNKKGGKRAEKRISKQLLVINCLLSILVETLFSSRSHDTP